MLPYLFLVLLPITVAQEWPRSWPHYAGKNRFVTNMNSANWRFGLNMDASFDSMDSSFVPNTKMTPNVTTVPSCFDAAPMGVSGPRGVGMYSIPFSHYRNKSARLHFAACSFYCRIYVDGTFVSDHRAGGYVAFHVDVPPPAPGTSTEVQRELFVLADNRFNSTTAPLHTGGDFVSIFFNILIITNQYLVNSLVLHSFSIFHLDLLHLHLHLHPHLHLYSGILVV